MTEITGRQKAVIGEPQECVPRVQTRLLWMAESGAAKGDGAPYPSLSVEDKERCEILILIITGHDGGALPWLKKHGFVLNNPNTNTSRLLLDPKLTENRYLTVAETLLQSPYVSSYIKSCIEEAAATHLMLSGV